ncbi:MAG: hypothetical protein ABR922_23550 [Streptosporangiaceae bacterium]
MSGRCNGEHHGERRRGARYRPSDPGPKARVSGLAQVRVDGDVQPVQRRRPRRRGGQRRRHVLPQPDDPDRDDFLDELFPGRPVVIDGRGLDPASSPTSASRIPA